MMKRFLVPLLLLLCWSALGQSSIQKNYFTTNDNPALTFTNGTLVSTNIYVSNLFATNVTFNYITNINEFRGRTTITTNLYSTNAVIQFLTNNFFYTTNVTEQFVTNQLSYITNLYGPFITNNTLYSTNIFTTNLFATYVTNNTDYITNLYGPFITNNTLYSTNIYVTNLTANYITNDTSYITNLFVTNVTANFITNNTSYITNLYSSNIFTTNLYATNVYTTNLYSSNIFTTNLYTSNLYATNIYSSNAYITNIYSSNLFTTNLISSNIFTTNIFVMEASWFTNRWVGPTNDVNFDATYQNFVASTDMEITGFQNSIATNANTSVLLLDPGGATRTLYFPAPWTNFTSDGNNAYVIPKTNTAIVTLFQYGNLYTNVVVRLFGPGTLGDTNFAYTDKSNAFSKTNYEALNFTTSTNLAWGPDFSVPESLISTNAAFTMVAPVGVDGTKTTVQWTLVNITNTTAAAVLITSPANVHTVGTPYVTNLTAVWFQVYGGAFTNAFYIPVF